MKPLAHARIAAARYGGTWQDYFAHHQFFDGSKAAFPSVQHRFFLHSDFGIALFARLYDTLTVGERQISCEQLGLDHLEEDLGRIVPLCDWIANIAPDAVPRRRSHPELRLLRDYPVDGCVARWGGTAADFEPLIAFFDEPRVRYCADDRRADLVLHNSFGIFLAEERFGAALTVDGKVRATRTIAEALVAARFGYIPTPAAIGNRMDLVPWMTGAAVPAALRARRSTFIPEDDDDE
jgi:hypothetical protein